MRICSIFILGLILLTTVLITKNDATESLIGYISNVQKAEKHEEHEEQEEHAFK